VSKVYYSPSDDIEWRRVVSRKKGKSMLRSERKQPGPPPVTRHIDDTPENFAKSFFGIKSDTLGKISLKRDKKE